jgi:MFS family permease
MLLALCPDLIVSSGSQPVATIVGRDLHASQLSLQLSSTLSDAGYALGAVIAVDLVQRLAQRRLFVTVQLAAAAGATLSAAAPDGWMFGAGRVIGGLATGLLLVIALPPLVTTFGARRIPATMGLVNIGLFGAAAAGPLVAAGVAATGAWRAEYAAVAVAGAVGAALVWRTIPDRDGLDPDQPLNPVLFPLAAAATVLPFYGVAQLADRPFSAAVVWAPLAAGVAALAALVVTQARRRSPLIPMARLNSTLPLAGTACAMIGGGAFVLVLQAVQEWMSDAAHRPAIDGATLLWPAALGATAAAVLFARSLRTRLLVAVIATGLGCLAAAAALATQLTAGGDQGVLVPVIALLLGFGAGMTVAPGLFTTALSIPSTEVARVVGGVELLRAEAAFLLAPVVTRLATQRGRSPVAVVHGVHVSAVIAVVVAGAGLVGLGVLLVSGRAAPQRPDLERWLGDDPGLTSPDLAEAVRN